VSVVPLRAEQDAYLTRRQLAEHMQVSLRTVDAWRAEGMPCHSWGRRLVRYRLREALAWAESQERRAA
jgi:phage terminase Nu1 subunit (DNA packaging protein)